MKQKNLPSRERQKKMSVGSHRQRSSTVDALLTGAIAKVKTEADAAIAKAKAETDEVITKLKIETKEKARALTARLSSPKSGTTAKVKPSSKVGALFLEAIAKQKAKSEAEIAKAIARVQAEAEAKANTDTDTKNRLKTQVKKTPAKPKTKSEAKTTKATAKVKTIDKEKAKTYTNKTSIVKPSSIVEALFSKAVAKQKAKSEAETAKAIAKAKAEAKEKAKTKTDTTDKVKPSSKVESLLLDAVTKQKAKSEAEIAEAIAKVKAETEEALAKQKAKSEAETAEAITKVKAETEEALAKQKAKSEAETAEAITRVKAETEEKPRAYTDTITEVKTEAEETTAEQKAKSGAEAEEEPSAYTDATARVKAEVKEARAEQKRKSEAEASEAIARVKAEAIEAIAKVQAKAEEEAAVYTVTIAKVKSGEKSATMVGSKDQPICETQRIPQSLTVLPDEYFLTDSGSPLFGLLQNENISLNAKDIMQKELVWGSADDSVRQTFTKMQQYNAGYVLVGHDGVLEGIVSKSDITGATSPYLQPAFARRREFLDDATLQIRIRWIMSRPVYIISPQTSLEVIMKHMCQFRRLCLPVVNQQSKVLGLVTQANILQALLQLQSSPGVSVSGDVAQVKPASGYPPHDSTTQASRTMETSPVYSQ
ncbi:MAG TPA: CBS domain-containing protein [Sedimentisphaerales bacterium]|nr:CBS domain-containing protein [Sedimentisphaerales bacterium]